MMIWRAPTPDYTLSLSARGALLTLALFGGRFVEREFAGMAGYKLDGTTTLRWHPAAAIEELRERGLLDAAGSLTDHGKAAARTLIP